MVPQITGWLPCQRRLTRAPPLPQLQATPIDTRGFQSLLSLVDNTANDSFELYYGLFMYNQVGRPPGCCCPRKGGGLAPNRRGWQI
jgi:hypothetical protein